MSNKDSEVTTTNQLLEFHRPRACRAQEWTERKVQGWSVWTPRSELDAQEVKVEVVNLGQSR